MKLTKDEILKQIDAEELFSILHEGKMWLNEIGYNLTILDIDLYFVAKKMIEGVKHV